jgi:hypothetical protein
MRLWQFSVLSAVFLLACGGGSPSGGADARPTVIVFNADAPVASTSESTDAAPARVVFDASAVDLWRDPNTLFPDCTGTADEISDCIINLPSRSGVAVTSAEPMDYSLCRR